MQKIFLYYFLWISFLIVISICNGYAAYKNNVVFRYVWFLMMLSCSVLISVVFWFVSKYSHKLIFDSLLFNAVIIITVTTTLSYFNLSVDFKFQQWFGIFLILIGILFFNW